MSKIRAGDRVIFIAYDYEYGDEELFKLGEILEVDYYDVTHDGNVIYFTDRNDGCWDWQIELVNDCKLNRILYPELKPDDEGNLR